MVICVLYHLITNKTMRYLLGLFMLLFVMTGCQHSSDLNVLNGVDDLRATSESVNTASVGQQCGEAGDKLCASGLECVFDNNDEGACAVKTVKANITCDKAKVPVCGQKGRDQVSYLNACEADRHGAEIVYEGFCQIDPEVLGNCGSKVLAIGNCGTRLEGFEYSITEKTCAGTVVRGCELQTPFEDLEACEATCING